MSIRPRTCSAPCCNRLGYDVTTDAAMTATLDRLDAGAKSLIGATIVVDAGAAAHVPLNAGDGEVTWRIDLEDGSSREGRQSPRADRTLAVDPLPAGYHRLAVESQDAVGSEGAKGTGWIIAAPGACFLPDALRDGRGFGIAAQVYGLRSSGNYGIGDFSDVADLGEGAGRFGAAFLGLSPLHALFPSDRGKISPYSPSSRLFIDPIFIDPSVLPDFASSAAARYLAEADVATELDRLRAAKPRRARGFVDYQTDCARQILGALRQQRRP